MKGIKRVGEFITEHIVVFTIACFCLVLMTTSAVNLSSKGSVVQNDDIRQPITEGHIDEQTPQPSLSTSADAQETPLAQTTIDQNEKLESDTHEENEEVDETSQSLDSTRSDAQVTFSVPDEDVSHVMTLNIPITDNAAIDSHVMVDGFSTILFDKWVAYANENSIQDPDLDYIVDVCGGESGFSLIVVDSNTEDKYSVFCTETDVVSIQKLQA